MNEPNVIAQLRDLIPPRPLTRNEAFRLADLQATCFHRLNGLTDGPVQEELITELPRLHVLRTFPLMSSGASQWSRGRWLILIKSSEPATRQRFSIAHEFKHILDNRDYDLMFSRVPEAERHAFIEQLCDYFAGSLLVPRHWLKRQWFGGTQNPQALAQHFNVSVPAIEVRLQQTGLAGPTARCLAPRAIAAALRPEGSAGTSAIYRRTDPLVIR